MAVAVRAPRGCPASQRHYLEEVAVYLSVLTIDPWGSAMRNKVTPSKKKFVSQIRTDRSYVLTGFDVRSLSTPRPPRPFDPGFGHSIVRGTSYKEEDQSPSQI